MINSKLIKQRRKDLGLSQQEVVEQVRRITGGLSQSSYVRIEQGGAERSKFLPYICQVLNLSLAEVDPQLKIDVDMGIKSIMALISNLPQSEQIQIAQKILSNLKP